MRIACPNCGAEYEVPDAMLAAGPRVLKCARCEHRFSAEAPRAEAPPEPPEPPAAGPEAGPAAAAQPEPPPQPDTAAPAAPRPPPEPPPARPPPTRGPSQPSPIEPVAADPPRGGAALVLAWLLSLAVLGGAGYAAFLYRAEIMEAWPPATRLFAALGLA
jgi:predicted Zn finger-like uncharacterized protein